MFRPLEPEESAENWRACRLYLRLWTIALTVPLILLLWYAGYAQGLLDACPPTPAITRNEGN